MLYAVAVVSGLTRLKLGWLPSLVAQGCARLVSGPPGNRQQQKSKVDLSVKGYYCPRGSTYVSPSN